MAINAIPTAAQRRRLEHPRLITFERYWVPACLVLACGGLAWTRSSTGEVGSARPELRRASAELLPREVPGETFTREQEPPDSRAMRVGAARRALSGRVLDAQGLAVENAHITLLGAATGGDRSRAVVSDEHGQFRLAEHPESVASAADEVTLEVWARGFAPRWLTLSRAELGAPLEVSLRRHAPPRAQVLDPEGEPVAGAVIIACAGRDRVELVSGPEGQVVFSPNAVGCLATAHHPRFARSEALRIGGRDTFFILNAGGAIQGFVSDPSGANLEGMEMTIEEFEPAPGELPVWDLTEQRHERIPREFELHGLCPGTYGLRFQHRSRQGTTLTTHTTSVRGVRVRAGAVTRDLHIVVGRTPLLGDPETDDDEPSRSIVTSSETEELPSADTEEPSPSESET